MIALYYSFGSFDSDSFINSALIRFTGKKGGFKIIRESGIKPYVREKNLYFSLSHTDGLTICAVSSFPVGADAEKRRTVKNAAKIAQRFLKRKLRETDDFISMWTEFESRVKYEGCGIANYRGEGGAETQSFSIGDYSVSVCAEHIGKIVKERMTMGILNRADIMLPVTNEPEKWSVVACDQYTSQPEYWERVKNFVGDAPSTLNLVYPEAFLSEGESRIEKINSAMKKYMEQGLFNEYKDCLIYVERTLSGGRVRRGIVGAVDLECYDFRKGAKSAIRATEGTVMSRIPPRVKIRENAPLELPHVMLLADDPEDVIFSSVSKGKMLYDFDLMENGGHLSGWLLDGNRADSVISVVDAFAQTAEDGLVFAVGDGNHSLATAKTCWDNIKASLNERERLTHPARFCLVEIENIYDKVLEFEPIHRIVFNVDKKAFTEKFIKECACTAENNGGQYVSVVVDGKRTDYYMNSKTTPLSVGTLQKFLDNEECEVDYIHGEDVVCDLSKKSGAVGFLLPKPEKDALFETVIKDGALPRKTFSMGEANEKRFYMEAKRIRPVC